jgi:hypothetical protein
MPAPTVDLVYPTSGATGIPVAPSIEITFSQDIDLASAKANVVIYGADFDQTSGPDLQTWIDNDTGNNPYFLKSPGFQGTVPCTYELVYVDGAGAAVDPQPSVYNESTVAYKHKLIIKPKELLAPDVKYNVYIIGDAETGTSKAISNRTVYDPVTGGATSTTAGLAFYGGYTGASDTLNLKVTTAGDIGTAKFKWWYTSNGEGSATIGKVTTSRFRKLEDGLQVRFTGSGFLLDDVYTLSVYAPVLLASSYTFSFTTGTGSIESVPLTASTSIIGSATDLTSEANALTVTSMTPVDGATHQAFSGRQILLTFSETLDASTITDANVTVTAYPVSGDFVSAASAGEPKELVKKLTVNGNILTIDL